MAHPAKHFLYTLKIIISMAFFSISGPAFCEGLLKDQALEYRHKGYEAQRAGMLGEALSYYQKAVQIDPFSAFIYNDLGVVYELSGKPDIAEQAYLKAININSNYGNAYYNLALLYESRGDLRQAAKYYLKLLGIDGVEDALIEKAHQRVFEIGRVIPEVRKEYLVSEASFLDNQVTSLKQRLSSDDKALAQFYVETADSFMKKRNYVRALQLYLDAKQLDPLNGQIDTLIETTQKKVLL